LGGVLVLFTKRRQSSLLRKRNSAAERDWKVRMKKKLKTPWKSLRYGAETDQRRGLKNPGFY